MAEYADKSEPKTKKLSKSEADAILKDARANWDRAYDREQSNIEAAYEDLEFLAAADQWSQEDKEQRKGRPCLSINQLPQFVHQVTGDIRQMRPAIKVVPVDDQADEEVADIKGGMIRYIENRSDASGIYFQAADTQVAAGIGHWRVKTEYADDSTFEQEIRIAAVDDGVSVLWDPDSKGLCREDAKFCFVPVDMTHDGFKKAYPDASMTDWTSIAEWSNLTQWRTDSYIRIAEYWLKKPIKRTLALTQQGQTIDLTEDDDEEAFDGLDLKGRIAVMEAMGARIEERESYKVCRYLMTAGEILEGPEEWIGRHIPIIPVFGEEFRIGRKIVRKGIVRHAKDAQRMYNYFRSAQTEVVALQPKAPFMLTEMNVAKYQDMWEQANTANLPYLVYEPDAKNGGQQPARVQPPVSSQGITEGIALSNDDMRKVIGIYDASLGARSNETSGVAIKARQREGDVGTYLYIDNFARAIRRTGAILIDLIPNVYDTERTIRIMGEDGKIDMLKINQAMAETDQSGNLVEKVLHDVTVGSYDVVTEVGPSYTTRREEAKEGMLEFGRAVPTVMPMILDLVAKAQDWPLADKIAKRARAAIPPQIIQAEEMEEQGANPEQIKEAMAQANQPPPDPKMIETQARLEMDQQRMQFEQQQAAITAQLKQMEIAVNERAAELQAQLKRDEIMMNAQLERERMALDSQTKIEIAQINAAVGQHKTIVQAGTEQMKTQTAAETAMYAVDNRPEPKPAEQRPS